MVEVGGLAPDFCLHDQCDKEVCLHSLRGKWVILYFYPKDNTKGCTLEAIDFSQNFECFKKLNTAILGVSPDSTQSHRRFSEKHSLTITLLSDPEHRVLDEYGVWQLKKLYGKNYFGVVRTTLIINPEGRIEHIWEKVKVKDHVEEVRKKLSEMQSKS